MYVCICTHIYHVCMNVHTYMYLCLYIHIHTNTHARARAHTHTLSLSHTATVICSYLYMLEFCLNDRTASLNVLQDLVDTLQARSTLIFI